MVKNSGTNIVNGLLSAIVLGCGVTFSALIGVLFRKVANVFSLGGSSIGAYSAYASSPLWSLGFAYIVPGLIGVIASLVRQKGGFITQMVFCILTLITMGLFFIVGIIALSAMSMFESSGCHTVGPSCICLNGLKPSLNVGYTCEDINSISGMSIGAVTMMVLGWIFTLIACTTGGILACSREVYPGMIIQPNVQPGVTVMPLNQMAGPPQGGYYPQTGYVGHPGYGAQPGYIVQPGYVAQPGYAAQPGYSTQPAGVVSPPSYPSDTKEHI